MRISGSHVSGGPGDERHGEHDRLLGLAGDITSDQRQQENGNTTERKCQYSSYVESV